VAITDQGFLTTNRGGLTNAQISLYTLPASDFHDETSGSNGYAATAGYDLVTGRGSPVANQIVHDLIYGVTAPQTHASSLAITPITTMRITFSIGLWTDGPNTTVETSMTNNMTQPFATPAQLPSVQSLGPNALTSDSPERGGQGEVAGNVQQGPNLVAAMALPVSGGATTLADEDWRTAVGVREPLPQTSGEAAVAQSFLSDVATVVVVPGTGGMDSAVGRMPDAAAWRAAPVDPAEPASESNLAVIADACFSDVAFLDASWVSPLTYDGPKQPVDVDWEIACWSAGSVAAMVALGLSRVSALSRAGSEPEFGEAEARRRLG
jgi:hypothetical protein